MPETHLILVHHLDEEWEGKAHLCQLGDGHTILRAVEFGCVVIDVNDQNVEGRGDSGIRWGAVIIQLRALQTEDSCPAGDYCFLGTFSVLASQSFSPRPQEEVSIIVTPCY